MPTPPFVPTRKKRSRFFGHVFCDRFATAIACALVITCAIAETSCRPKSTWYESEVELKRFDVVRRDAHGTPSLADVEFEWSQCPGSQVEVIRGGKDFAACMARRKLGDRLRAKVERHPAENSRYDWDVHALGECARPPSPNDEASFDAVQECEEIVIHGVAMGFHCNRIPRKSLLNKCPWFER